MSSFMDVFKWKSWDQFNYKFFYECTLLRKIGDFDAGTYFNSVIFDDEKMILEFYMGDDVEVPVMVKSFRLCE